MVIGTARAYAPDMSQTADELKRRTMQFALDVGALIRDLPMFEPGPTRNISWQEPQPELLSTIAQPVARVRTPSSVR
jgi:hypothetical protein